MLNRCIILNLPLVKDNIYRLVPIGDSPSVLLNAC